MQLSDQQVRSLLDSAPDAMVIADHQGVIVFVNAQTERLFGYTREELIGNQVECLLPERLRGAHPGHRTHYVHAPRVRPMGINLDLYARRRDGSEFPVEISLSPLHTDEGLLVSSAIRDITDRKLILEQLKEARNEAEKANRAKSSFLATASHDLRQPLQTLILLNSVLQKTAGDPRAAAAVATQQEALTSMAALVNALLDISKLESGAVRPEIGDYSVQEIFQRLQASFGEEAKAKGLQLVVEKCDEVLRTDRNLLEQIIQNLVANAVRYTREGTIWLRCVPAQTFVRIEVADTGIGIPGNHKDAIFEEFYQLNREPGEKREGLGLGLAIVRRITQLLDLKIEVDSQVGVGSRFAVDVPKGVRTAQNERAESMPVEVQTKMACILLIDDDPSVSKATRLLLEIEGHEVWTAASLEQCLNVLNQQARIPDLIVSDFHLGGGATGIEVITRVRERFGQAIPAILVTGDTSSRMVDAVERSGACEVLSKPVVPMEFLERVGKVLRTNGS